MTRPDRPVALAIDIGGTKFAAAAVDAGGRLLARREVPTPHGDADAVWAAVCHLVDELRPWSGQHVGVGIGSAGPVDGAAGAVSPVNIPAWRRFPIVERVRELLGGEVRLAGDGVCMALGEATFGAGRDVRDMLGVVVSTGVGGGLVLNDRPHVGPTGNAGHVGHVSVDLDGPACSCGSRGCVEAISSGPAIVRWAVAQGLDGVTTAADVARLAQEGDPVAGAAFDRAARALASMLTSVVAVTDVDVAVIGGGVARAGATLFAPLRAWLDRFAGLDFVARLDVRAAELGPDAGLVGAACLFRSELGIDETAAR